MRDLIGNLLAADGTGANGFEVVADAWNKAVLELVREVLVDGFEVPEDSGFVHCGQWIQNPFYDETLRFEVEPLSYYGAENVRKFVDDILTKKQPEPEKRFVAGDYVSVLISDCCDGMAKVLDVTESGMTMEMVEGRYWMIHSGSALESNPMEVPFEWIEEIEKVDPETFKYGPINWSIDLDDRLSDAQREYENMGEDVGGKPKEIEKDI